MAVITEFRVDGWCDSAALSIRNIAPSGDGLQVVLTRILPFAGPNAVPTY